ncbi:O-antigen ligase family protein [Clostridium ganghwense]|uniref:O-antigen ligase family protein n=1 Tax=Clostridium ganghwense TaxID=312089 RepID=A0ABT4CPL3_9CLOT|nr:O-antigen ligase family protein [Clostridium ganghwense]MCY6370893.1 O-antigen ligase family protein [Clostridium ganghwense]
MKKNKVQIYILIALIILFPYNTLGEGFGSVILTFAAVIFLHMYRKEEFKLDKKYLYFLSVLCGVGVVSLGITKDTISSLTGLTIYINAVLFYIIFSNLRKVRKHILEVVTYLISASTLVFVIYQGIILHKRIDGNLGYANTYALVLIIGLYINEILREEKLSFLFEIILIVGIFYTGSRNSLFYLIIFLGVRLFYNFKKEKFISLWSLFIALLIYIGVEYLGIGIMFIIPLVLYLLHYIGKKMSLKSKNFAVVIVGILSITFSMFFKTQWLLRIKNISFKTPVLQERLVYYDDVLKSIIKNPMGHGINAFEYRQYLEQSAFYDVRYVHNSILQRGYDLGILGVLIFVIIGGYGIYLLVKSDDENKKYYIPLVLSIYCHSLLDFDFAYPQIFIFVVMIVAFGGAEKKLQNIKNKKIVMILGKFVLILFSVYLIMINFMSFIGSNYENKGKYEKALGIYNIEKNITFKNPKNYAAIAQVYNKKYLETGNEENLKRCIENLEKAHEINGYDPRIVGNLAFSYDKLKDDNKAVKYYEEFIEKEKFYYPMYNAYYNFLNSRYDSSKDSFYSEKIKSVIEIYSLNYKKLNPRAKYMKEQMVKPDINKNLNMRK